MKYQGVFFVKYNSKDQVEIIKLIWFLENIDPPFYFEKYEPRGISGIKIE